MRDDWDAIVVGAGIGGLVAAARLALAGRNVLVLEQDGHVGGTAQAFERRGFWFPTGPLGFTMPGYLACALAGLGVRGGLDLERAVFQVRRGALDVMISAPLTRVADQLTARFPDEIHGIRAVVAVLEEVISALRVLRPEDLMESRVLGGAAPPAVAEARATLERWGGVPAQKLLERHVRHPAVRDLLGSQGTSGAVMSVVLLAQMWDFMAGEGIWYPRAGIQTLGEVLAGRVQELGGEVVLGEAVKEILVHDGAVAGVRTAARTVRTTVVISDADYRSLFRDLLVSRTEGQVERHVADSLPLSSSAFTVFLGVDAARVDLSAFRGHHLLARLDEGEPVPWEMKRPRAEDFRADELWLSWWSRHGAADGRRAAPLGAEALVLKVMAPWGPPFSTLDGGGRRRHKEPYYRLKEEFSDAVVAAAAEVLPGLARAVLVREAATPLTYRYWGHRSGGSVAGWSWRAADLPGAWTQSFTRTSVRGLLVAGMQAYTRLFFGGTGTAVYSGLKAAEAALEGL